MEKEKQITLSKNGFLFKIIKFTFGLDPSLAKSLCPIFWIFLASLVLCVPVGIFKGLKFIAEKILNYIVTGFGKFLDYVDNSWYENKYLENLSNSQIYYLKCKAENRWRETIAGDNFFKEKIDKASRTVSKILKDVMKKRGLTSKDIDFFKEDYYKEVEELKNEIKKKEDAYVEKLRKKDAEKLEIKETLYKISNISKKIFQVIFITILGVAFFSVSMILCKFWIWSFADTTSWQLVINMLVDFLKFLGCLAVVVFLGVLVLYIIYVLQKRYEITINFKNPIFKPFIWFGRGIYYLFYIGLWKMTICGISKGFYQGFVEFGGVFGKYFSAAYSDYCPMVEWKEENDNK